MTTRETFFAVEARALRRLADLFPGRGAITLLGAPMLAVIATFWLQPKASGFEANAEAGAERAAYVSVPGATSTLADPAPDEAREPFAHIALAIDAKDLDRAGELLALTTPSQSSTAVDRQLWQAYALMVECLKAPSNDLTANAYRFYLEQAPAHVRRRLRKACLPDD